MRKPGPLRKTSGGRWEKVRQRILKRDKHLCQVCLKRGRPTPAAEVDHVVPLFKGGTDDDANLQAICRSCHDSKTRAEQGHKASGGCDANGFPTDSRHYWSK